MRLWNGKLTSCYKDEPQYVLENSHNKLYYDSSTTTDQTVHNDRPDIVTLDKTNKEEYLIDVTIPISFDLYSNINGKLQKDTYLK